jgi:hypothetical protein
MTGSGDDARFEQALLDIERRSADAPDVEQAWSRFCTSVGFVGAGLEQASGVHDIRAATSARGAAQTSGTGSPERELVASASAGGLARLAGAKLSLVAVGAALGCAGTLAVMFALEKPAVDHTPRGDVHPISHAASAPSMARAEAIARATNELPAREAPPAKEAANEPAPLFAPAETARSESRSRAPRATPPTHAASADSAELAAEVEHLDWVRRLSASGQPEQVLRSVDKFHERFPDGVLAPEAEVLALQALVALRRDVDLDRRAKAFERRYPNSPHLQRVRDWLQ